MNRCVPLTKSEMLLLIELIKAEREREHKRKPIYDEVLSDLLAKLEVMKNAKQ